MSSSLRVGIAGLGTVGASAIRLLERQSASLAARTGRTISLAAVSARDRAKERGVDVKGAQWFDDPVALAQTPGIDLFVELMGGDEGPARQAVETALRAGKPVVTANKALLAHHGMALAKLAAEQAGVALSFRGFAVAGAIPAIVKVLARGACPATRSTASTASSTAPATTS